MDKTKKQSIPKKLKQLVWDSYIGNEKGIGICQCCQKESIAQMSFHCGHIISEFNGGKLNVNNLKPICSLCNGSMGKMNMDEYMEKIGVLDKKYTIKQNNKYSQIVNDNTELLTNNLYQFLNNLKIVQLRQLCRSLSTIDRTYGQVSNNISPNGTKPKIINKIIKNGYTLLEIKKMIEGCQNKKYFIICGGSGLKKCNDCTINDDLKCVFQCEKCDETHAYYTNTKISDENDVKKNGYVLILKKTNKKCISCNYVTTMDEYENSFYIH